jgi:hypothetical protein
MHPRWQAFQVTLYLVQRGYARSTLLAGSQSAVGARIPAGCREGMHAAGGRTFFQR